MSDKYAQFGNSLISPASSSFAIVPHDSEEQPSITKAIYVGTGGDVSLRLADDASDRVFRNVADGSILDLRVRFVRATGTTAADLVGLS